MENEASDSPIKSRTVCRHKSSAPAVRRTGGQKFRPPRRTDSCWFHALTFGQHAHLLALPQPTLLAFPAHVHVHFTVPATLAFVHSILRDAPPEETCTGRKKKRFSQDHKLTLYERLLYYLLFHLHFCLTTCLEQGAVLLLCREFSLTLKCIYPRHMV